MARSGGNRKGDIALSRPTRAVWQLFIVGLVFSAIKIGSETGLFYFMPHEEWYSPFLLHLSGGIGEFIIIAATVAYLFAQVDQYEFMNKILDHRDMLVAVSNAGVDGIVANPTESPYVEEINKHQKLIVCLRNSKSFFTNRQLAILERLDSGKSIDVYCGSAGVTEITAWKEEMERKGWNMSGMKISAHQTELAYNFLECDTGIWIKTYFNKFYNHKIAAPAFFIRKDSILWESYRRDIDLVMGVSNG